jgi:4-hydroxy-tetrahydrodipicolinate synthase
MEQAVMSDFQAQGAVVPLVTPFQRDETLDIPALRRLTRRMIDSGVDGLFPAGSTGEFYMLSPDECLKVTETVIEEAAGKVPIYAGACAISTREAIEAAHQAEALGADAVVVVTPFYISPSQDELYEHYAAIAASTRLPVIPYNNPGRTGGVNVAPATLRKLAAIDNIVAIKDSAGNIAQTVEYIKEVPAEFSVFQGLDSIILPSLAMGARGCVAAIANVIPDIVVELCRSFAQGDWERAREAQAKVTVLRQSLALGTFPAALKAAMDMIGESAGPARRPVTPLGEAQSDQLSQMLTRIGIQVHLKN